MTRQYTGPNNVTISMLDGRSVPIVSQTEIDPMKTALSLMLALVTTRALTELLPVAKPQSPAPSSVCLDVGRPDHLGPFLGFVGDELAKIGGRARKPRTATFSETPP